MVIATSAPQPAQGHCSRCRKSLDTGNRAGRLPVVRKDGSLPDHKSKAPPTEPEASQPEAELEVTEVTEPEAEAVTEAKPKRSRKREKVAVA